MKKLFVEELESRNLLSVTGFDHALHVVAADLSHQNPEPIAFSSPRSFGDFNSSDRYQTDIPARFEDFETVSNGNPAVPLSPADLRTAVIPTRFENFETVLNGNSATPLSQVESEATETIIIVPVRSTNAINLVDGPSLIQTAVRQAISAGLGSGTASTLAPVLPGSPAAIQRPTSNLAEVAAVAGVETGSAVSAGPAEAIASALSIKAATPITARGDSFAASSFRNNAGTLFNSGGPVRAGADGGAAAENPPYERGPALPPAPPSPPLELPPSPLAQSIRIGLASMPQFADLLGGITTLNFDRIEQGMANFITSLEGTSGPALAVNQRDLYPWMLAAVATAVACELARRQLKHSATADAFDLATLPIAPWELPREPENGRTAR